MAFTEIVPVGNRSGTVESPGISVPAGASVVTFRLTSNNWPVTTDTMEFALDRSDDDGATWREITTGTITEGGRSRSGDMPAIGLSTNGEAFQVRARCIITGSMRFGVEWEVL